MLQLQRMEHIYYSLVNLEEAYVEYSIQPRLSPLNTTG